MQHPLPGHGKAVRCLHVPPEPILLLHELCDPPNNILAEPAEADCEEVVHVHSRRALDVGVRVVHFAMMPLEPPLQLLHALTGRRTFEGRRNGLILWHLGTAGCVRGEALGSD